MEYFGEKEIKLVKKSTNQMNVLPIKYNLILMQFKT